MHRATLALVVGLALLAAQPVAVALPPGEPNPYLERRIQVLVDSVLSRVPPAPDTPPVPPPIPELPPVPDEPPSLDPDALMPCVVSGIAHMTLWSAYIGVIWEDIGAGVAVRWPDGPSTFHAEGPILGAESVDGVGAVRFAALVFPAGVYPSIDCNGGASVTVDFLGDRSLVFTAHI